MKSIACKTKTLLPSICMLVLATFMLLGCQSNVPENTQPSMPGAFATVKEEPDPEPTVQFPKEFDRKVSFQHLKQKVRDGEPLVVHLRIPLCDNKNQGIANVPAHLGRGQDLNGNLYWGAMYGFKTHFRKRTDWQFLATIKDVAPAVLERLVFSKKFDNGAKVYLVADAYAGDRMETCLKDYFKSLAGMSESIVELDKQKIKAASRADLQIFSGHNGLMEYQFDYMIDQDSVIREAAVIGCFSKNFFNDHLLMSKSYPLLMTTNYMAPEAYVLEAIIDSWAELKTEQEIRLACGAAYNKYQKCGIKGATNLFSCGW